MNFQGLSEIYVFLIRNLIYKEISFNQIGDCYFAASLRTSWFGVDKYYLFHSDYYHLFKFEICLGSHSLKLLEEVGVFRIQQFVVATSQIYLPVIKLVSDKTLQHQGDCYESGMIFF